MAQVDKRKCNALARWHGWGRSEGRRARPTHATLAVTSCTTLNLVGAAMNADIQRAGFSAATLTSWPDICRTWRVNASHGGVGDGAPNSGARPAGRAVLKCLEGATRNADTRPGARPRSVLAVATSAFFNFDAWFAAWDPRNGATCRRRSMRFELKGVATLFCFEQRAVQAHGVAPLFRTCPGTKEATSMARQRQHLRPSRKPPTTGVYVACVPAGRRRGRRG